MGIIRQEILGGFRKKTGSVVGAYWRTLDVIRGLPRISGKAPTQQQRDQQFKFGLVTGLLSNISHLIDIGFASAAKAATPMNDAVAYHLKNAILGISPVFTLDYTKLKFSRGKLELPGSMDVASTTSGKVDFNWVHTGPDDKLVDATDQANVLVYCPALNRFASLRAAAARSVQTYKLNVPIDFSGETVHCYLSFTSVKKKLLSSNSYHVGSLVLV